MSSYVHTFPCVRGMQAGRPCYIAMCPMRLVPRIFVFNEENVPADLRAQRKLNLARVPEIASYLVENRTDYTLSAITASVNATVQFDPFSDTGSGQNIGTLSIPMDAQILINDGQHRRAAIEQAIQENPELGYDNIPVLFFIDDGLQRSQQMFADLNKHAVRPSDSISTLYDHRDHISDLARYLV
ncbi:DNA sulfur modification protein DndB, partial [Pseudomonas aeruginosa]